MIETIKAYYQAWVSNDFESLHLVLAKDFFGVRTYQEEVLFTWEELQKTFQTHPISSFELASYKEHNEQLIIVGTINKVKVEVKFLFQDAKIVRVYEKIQTGQRRIKCTCSYDGSFFSGFQKQPNASSIQETIEKTLQDVLKDDSIQIHASGRTDKGVHAFEQVFHFDTNSKIPADKLPQIINSFLVDSIHILSSVDVEETFHSRYDLKKKQYLYKINTSKYDVTQRNYEWTVPNLNLPLYKEALKEVIGTHDFTSFTKTSDTSNIRTIFNVEVKEEDGYILTYIEGNGFLRYMVRNIIAAGVLISQGKLCDTMTDLLQQKDVNLLKTKAPAAGLYLNHITY